MYTNKRTNPPFFKMAECTKSEEMDTEKKADDNDGKEKSERVQEPNVESADEPKGKHALYMYDALNKTLKKCLSETRYSVFARNYQFAHKQKPRLLKSLFKKFTENLKSSAESEFELMIKEENLVALCNDLDKIIDETENSQHAWRPTRDAEKDLLSHCMVEKLQERDKLLEQVKQLEKEHSQLKEAFIARRTHLLSIEETLQKKLKNIDEAAELCRKTPVAEMESLVWQACGMKESPT
ncbi:polyamine-modulated factor 1-like [Saccoglossus kowalevskii]|uniref:Polyamine-modulated factor 1-like n=1 Tax=Saccoglossus kowalevskii TaxID=10224 RepID=A0ABM0GP77_SACKO|nr:PREDICTED: polyamine-modulated factor 1-like [Saccoglossus kowalevskii]